MKKVVGKEDRSAFIIARAAWWVGERQMINE